MEETEISSSSRHLLNNIPLVGGSGFDVGTGGQFCGVAFTGGGHVVDVQLCSLKGKRETRVGRSSLLYITSQVVVLGVTEHMA